MARKTTKKSTRSKRTPKARKPAAKSTRAASKNAKSAGNSAKAMSKTNKTTKSPPSVKRAAPPPPAPVPAPAPAAAVPESPAAASERKQLTSAQLRRVKTGLTKKDYEHYRQLLLEKRAELLGDVASLQTDARRATGNHFSPEHMADVGSDNYEQEFTLGLVESERKLLREIDEALARIDEKTYGVCLESGTPINRARLDAKPWAKYCIEIARERERLGLSA